MKEHKRGPSGKRFRDRTNNKSSYKPVGVPRELKEGQT
jgi:hypothetical protein